MRNAGLEEAQAGIKIAGRNINNLRYADDTTLVAESEKELRRLLMKVKREWKTWLKTQHPKKWRSWHPVPSLRTNRWGKSGNSVVFHFLGLQNHCRQCCSHEIKGCLFLGRKAMTNLDNVLKSRDITLPTKADIVKAMVFPVVMYGCESWTIKKTECQRIDAVKLWCWRRLLRVPWTASKSNQSILKEISPEYSLEGLMLKLKL